MRAEIQNINSTVHLDYVCNSAIELSHAAEEKLVSTWEEHELSQIFAKMVLSCIGFLKFIPDSSWFIPAKGLAIWDVGSASSICRNVMEAYFSFAYMALPGFPEQEPGFKRVLWEYHDAFERHAALKIGLPASQAVQTLDGNLAKARDRVLKSPYFQNLSEGHRNNLLNGEQFKLLDNVELSRRVGIHPDYYRMQYKNCSAFTHTAPFSISLMQAFVPGSEKAQAVIRMLVATVCVFMVFGLRDFDKVFHSVGANLTPELQEIIRFVESLARWDVPPDALVAADRLAKEG